MPKQFLRKLLPSPTYIKRMKGLSRFGDALERRALWHVSRLAVARATAIGLFCAMIPLPGQMFVATFLAIRFSANVPIAFSLVFVTNPLTMPIIYLAAYVLGAGILDVPVINVSTIDWLNPTSPEIRGIWPSFLLGCGVIGISAAFLGYFLVDGVWRIRLMQRLAERTRLRRARK